MGNFDENNQISVADFILSNLPTHKQFALSTIDDNNNPWVVCVNLSFDSSVNFIWKSEKSTEHSKYILHKPSVAICVFSDTEEVGGFGYYCKAIAHEVTDKNELNRLLDIRFAKKGKPVPPIYNFLGESPTRIYYADVKEAWVNDNRHLKVSVDLNVLKDCAKK